MFLWKLSFLIILFVIRSKANLEWGEECELENGSMGVCIEASKCQHAYRNIISGNQSNLSQSIRKETIVCCDDVNVKEIAGIRSVQACKKWGPNLYQPDRILGGDGDPTSSAEFPHMAALGFEDTENNDTYWGCGGSLISLKFVLTAAHCLYSIQFGPVKYVRLGDLNLRTTDDEADPQDFLVSKTYKHPLYKRPSKYHDIALIVLDRLAVITDFVLPACLNINMNTSNNRLITTGWGLVPFSGIEVDHLQKLNLHHVNNSDCKKAYDVNHRTLSEGIHEQYQICAGYQGKDICQGNSGGPLQSRTRLGNFYIHGVTSFGNACRLTKSSGVYTRVANYIDWIESIVWANTE
ncbi:PREDICTED: venom protease-like [Nicrophorus vespilloides]|uniref:Venom protease-like n=1 Tax=Nicrophorus vespilloides TaxID=110193 RepID=A0ABM1N9D6_NICVS|nr:PREDICTED: venom protease-like [Nicrophorus vespilloides]